MTDDVIVMTHFDQKQTQSNFAAILMPIINRPVKRPKLPVDSDMAGLVSWLPADRPFTYCTYLVEQKMSQIGLI